MPLVSRSAVPLLLLTLVLAGCAFPLEEAGQRTARVEDLTRELMALSPEVPPQEAREFALKAVETSAELGRKYQVNLRPWLHNASILVGLKQRGLCYQYADDLYDNLKEVKSSHLQLRYVAANPGQVSEHHALTVVVLGAAWDSGLILDAWRRNGNLVYGPLKADSYAWLDDGTTGFDSAGRRP